MKESKEINSNTTIRSIGQRGWSVMRTEQIRNILNESVKLAKGGRAKNLKAYIRFFKEEGSKFEVDKREPVENGYENEYMLIIEGYNLHFDEWDWGIVLYHAGDEEGTKTVERYLKNHGQLRKPWIKKNHFESLIQNLNGSQGRTIKKRAMFDPYNEYSGYGLSLRVRGRMTSNVFDELEEKYAIHPINAGIEIINEDNKIKFEITNDGRMSFSSGTVDDFISIIVQYQDSLRRWDEEYDFLQSRQIQIDDVILRQNREILTLKMPSIEKIRGNRDDRNKAIVNMLSFDKDYISMNLGIGRISVLDLVERKTMEVKINDDEVYIYSENPSDARSAIHRLVSKMAMKIDPDITINKIKIGEENARLT